MQNHSIENLLGTDLQQILKEAVQNKYVYTKNRFHAAKVIDNNDPKKLGRVKVRVYGIYDDEIPDSDLPWALPDFDFIGSTKGSFIVPVNDALVNVYFENNDIYLPKYTNKVIQKDALESMTADYANDYPDTMVFFETDNGDYFKINRNTLDMEFRHASGLLIMVDKDGNVEVDNTKTNNGNFHFHVSGNVVIDSAGDATIQTGPTGAIRLKTGSGDSQLWQPSVLPNCLFTGTPHGGPGAGITNLTGK